jgi:hypothetical protein
MGFFIGVPVGVPLFLLQGHPLPLLVTIIALVSQLLTSGF